MPACAEGRQGKRWFYAELGKLGNVHTLKGYETKELRDRHGFSKSSNKLSNDFSAHCVDSWILANWFVGGHISPDNKDILLVTPFRFYRRQLHALQPSYGGIRRLYCCVRWLNPDDNEAQILSGFLPDGSPAGRAQGTRHGGTRSEGEKRGSYVKHPKYGVCFAGGASKGRISLHSLEDGKRLTQNTKPSECKHLTYASFRTWR